MPPWTKFAQHILGRIEAEVLSSGPASDYWRWRPWCTSPSYPVEALTNQSQQKCRPIDRPARCFGHFGPRRINLLQQRVWHA